MKTYRIEINVLDVNDELHHSHHPISTWFGLSLGGASGGPDPDRDVLWRTQLVHRQHPPADFKPRRKGPDGGAVQRAAEAPAEPTHPGALDPQCPLNSRNLTSF